MKESNPITWFICFDIFRGILDACPRYGIYATVADLSEKDDLETKRQRLLDGKTQGFIFIQTSGYEDIIEELKEKRCPVVIAHGTGEEKNIGSIVLDRKKGTYDAVQYLIKLGHRRIGFLSGSISSLYYRSKLAGYTKALNDNGIPIENELIQECEEPKCEKLKFLELKHRPTAIFACSDYRALDAMRLIKRKGLSIPEDMALIGVDDMPDAETSNPPLTTLHAPNYQSGVEAMELLVKLIKNKSLKKKQIFLAMNLIIRKTCGGA
jgi:DNA-binding LacI/PurR family transcriptional regulator